MISRSAQTLHQLLESKPVVQLDDIRAALGNASRATAFRYLQQIAYRHSYSHNGRYYTRHIPTRYDRFGLFSHQGIPRFESSGRGTAPARAFSADHSGARSFGL